jgi:hypothetical protein
MLLFFLFYQVEIRSSPLGTALCGKSRTGEGVIRHALPMP